MAAERVARSALVRAPASISPGYHSTQAADFSLPLAELTLRTRAELDQGRRLGAFEGLREAELYSAQLGRASQRSEILMLKGLLLIKAGLAEAGLQSCTMSGALLLDKMDSATPALSADIWHCQAQALALLGRIDEAVFLGKRAVNQMQQVRSGLKRLDPALQRSFDRRIAALYTDLADLLIDQGRVPEAQQVLGMLKEGEYFEFIGRSASDDPRSSRVAYTLLESSWLRRLTALTARLSAIGTELSPLQIIKSNSRTSRQSARSAKLLEERQKLEADYVRFFNELKAAFEAASAEQLQGLNTAEIGPGFSQGDLRTLGEGTVVVHYLVTDERLRILLTGADSRVVRDAPVSRLELNRLIFAFRGAVQNPDQNPRPAAQALYSALIAPIESDLTDMGAKTLMLYLDEALRYVPMAALHDGKSWLTERYAIALFTPAAGRSLTARSGATLQVSALGVSLGGLGFSPLPAVPYELQSIVNETAHENGVAPGRIYLDRQFSRQSLGEALSLQYPVVHIASHFKFVPGKSSDSFLLLGDQTKLTLEELRTDSRYRFTNVDLLTLSACETGLSEGRDAESGGREVEGLGALAQRRGAAAVLATLWPVVDATTGAFMASLYARRSEQINKAQAVRQSQLAFINGMVNESTLPEALRGARREGIDKIKSEHRWILEPDKPYAHPFYWAPFILMGNWL